ncbi:hypothetical protein [Marimonas lutisalis]|uniref:hypothetical protein n=1 Tax=Marimonas lutisalis TaxID=2545756 RepID=UPI0010F9D272|nr:hypothetical protein [Marimonas lutisalis]
MSIFAKKEQPNGALTLMRVNLEGISRQPDVSRAVHADHPPHLDRSVLLTRPLPACKSGHMI